MSRAGLAVLPGLRRALEPDVLVFGRAVAVALAVAHPPRNAISAGIAANKLDRWRSVS